MTPDVRRKVNIMVTVGFIVACVVMAFVLIKSVGKADSINATMGKKNEAKLITAGMEGATIKTNKGTMVIEFLEGYATSTIKNFVTLAEKGFYTDTKFHRVIKDFMIQGGDPNTKGTNIDTWGTGGPGYKFDDEINPLPIVNGVVAMANSGPNTNGSQFFIVTAGNASWLNGKHTVFARLIQGKDVLDAINNVPTYAYSVMVRDVPVSPVVIEDVQIY